MTKNQQHAWKSRKNSTSGYRVLPKRTKLAMWLGTQADRQLLALLCHRLDLQTKALSKNNTTTQHHTPTHNTTTTATTPTQQQPQVCPDERRNGPCRVPAPQRPAPEGGKRQGVGSEQYDTTTIRSTSTHQPELFELSFDEEPGGWNRSSTQCRWSRCSTALTRGFKQSSRLWRLCRANTSVYGSFQGFLARAARTWKYGALFPCGLVSCSPVSCAWVLHMEYRIGFFGRCCDSLGACLARHWIHVLHQYLALLDEVCTLSTVKWTRILRVFSLRSHAEWRSVLSRCFSSQSWYASSHLENLEITSTRFTWLRRVTIESIFRSFLAVFSGLPPLGVESQVVMPIHLDRLWPYASCLRARVQNNNRPEREAASQSIVRWVVRGGQLEMYRQHVKRVPLHHLLSQGLRKSARQGSCHSR